MIKIESKVFEMHLDKSGMTSSVKFLEELAQCYCSKTGSYFGISSIIKKFEQKVFGYKSYLVFRDNIRYFRSKWRVVIKKRIQ